MAFHLFHITEVYSSADGTIQFVELLGESNSQNFLAGNVKLEAVQGGTTNTFVFPSNLPSSSTSGRSVLIATQAFADLAVVTPDFILPNGFLFTTGSVTVRFVDTGGQLYDTTVLLALPRDGTLSSNGSGATATNSPRNFANQTGTIVLGPSVVSPTADQFIGNGQAFALDVTDAFSEEGLTYAAFTDPDDPLPGWLTFDGEAGTFSGTPGPGDVAPPPLTIRVTASDGEAATFDVFSVTVISGHVLTASPGGGSIAGTANADRLIGQGGNDTLNGAADNDTMIGGAGNDTYVVDGVLDVVTETAGQGSADLIESSLSLTLATNVENLTLTGSENINGTGNAANNTITGNSGDNSLDGLAGDDSMAGGAGNDTYTVDSGADSVTEGADPGVDTVLSSVSRTLGPNQEILVLGGVALNGTGNSGANTITGNGNDNFLNGAGGADSMEGGNGNDVFMVDDPGDIATDSGTGTDRVESTVSFTIGTGIEHLTLMGGDEIDGTGNAAGNILRGNTAANNLSAGAGADTLLGLGGHDSMSGGGDDDRLDGGEGNDTLQGGAGADRLDGGQGADAFVFADAGAADTIREFHSGEDEIRLDNDVFTGIGGPGALTADDVQFGLRSEITAGSGGGDLLKFATDTGELFYDADGAGNGGPLLIFTIISCSASGTTLDLGAAQDLVAF